MDHLFTVAEHQVTPSIPSMRSSDSKRRCEAYEFLGERTEDLRFPDLSIGDVMDGNANDSTSHCVSAKSMWIPKKLVPLTDRLSFTAHDNDDQTMEEISRRKDLFFFSTDCQERYIPFCADFGPVNLSGLVHFCRAMRAKEDDKRIKHRHLVYYFTNDKESSSNAAFLLSAYLMLEHNFSPEDAVDPFTGHEGCPIAPFRDATFSTPTFGLTLLDCLHGLKKAKMQGWFDHHTFDTDEYEYYDDPDSADMHRICPKFLAFRGPDDRLPKQRNLDMDNGRALHPKQYVQLFKKLGCSAIVRLNETETYKNKIFLEAGFRHADFFFGDCTTPSDEIVLDFLKEVKEADGCVAVHCLAGLGRTGTLIGIWLMLEHHFTAREAIAWMRIVRPGMVIGQQQQYLAHMEVRIRDGQFPPRTTNQFTSPTKKRTPTPSRACAPLPTPAQAQAALASKELAQTVEHAMRNRASVKRRAFKLVQ